VLRRTLVDLRSEVQTRLGFGMSGQAGIVNSPLIDSFLRSAQEQLYWQFEWADLRATQERLTGAQQAFYDYPDDCNVERVVSVSIQHGGIWSELEEGISLEQRSLPLSSWPGRYERFAQLELFPVPAEQMGMRIEYVKALAPFSSANDRTSILSEAVFLMALVLAKNHYNQKDAGIYQAQLDALLARLKAKHRTQSVWGRSLTSREAKDRLYSYPF
jgi:hypothetical protein